MKQLYFAFVGECRGYQITDPGPIGECRHRVSIGADAISIYSTPDPDWVIVLTSSTLLKHSNIFYRCLKSSFHRNPFIPNGEFGEGLKEALS